MGLTQLTVALRAGSVPVKAPARAKRGRAQSRSGFFRAHGSLLAALLFALALPTAAAAQDGLDVAPEAVAACLQTATFDNLRPDCIGAAAESCMALPDGATTFGITTCLAAEGKVWQDLLTQELAGLEVALQALDERRAGEYAETRPQLDAAQTAWQNYRMAQCNLETGIVIDGTIRGPVSVGCKMEMTAKRAVQLHIQRLAVE